MVGQDELVRGDFRVFRNAIINHQHQCGWTRWTDNWCLQSAKYLVQFVVTGNTCRISCILNHMIIALYLVACKLVFMIILRCHQDVGEAATDHWWEEKRNVSEVWLQQINTQICSFYPRPMCFQGSDPSKLWLSNISSILRPRPHPVGAVQYAGQRQTQVHQVLKRWWNLTQGCLPQLQGWLLQLEASQRTSFCCWLWSPGSFNEKIKSFFYESFPPL